jgi:hypothetical protein
MSIIAQLIGLIFALLLSLSTSAVGKESVVTRVVCKKVHGKCITKKASKKTQIKVVKRRYQGRLGTGPLDGNIFERRRKLAFENKLAYEQRLPRFQALDEIRSAQSKLVRVPDDTPTFYIDDHVNHDRRYLQQWSYDYLVELAADFMREVGGTTKYPKIKVTSMVRDMGYQRKLPSAAQCWAPESCSTHLTGASFDISFKGMSREQKSWMYRRLSADRNLGVVNAIHEPWSGCFHIFVIKPDEEESPAPTP